MDSGQAIDIILSGIDAQGLQELCNQGIDFIYPDWGLTALGLAISCYKDESAATLLEHGANPNVFGEKGNPPLIEACLSRDARLVALLLLYGADPELKSPGGFNLRETPAINRAREFLENFRTGE